MASSTKVWRHLVGVDGQAVVESWDFDELAEALVVHVRPYKRRRRRCAHCARRCPSYDRGAGRRRWRSLDLGTVQTFLEADAPRVRCPTHGVVVAAVPWARPDSTFTRAFEDQCAWLAVHTSRTAVAALMRVAWRSVGRMIERVAGEQGQGVDLLANLRRIGIDELSYRKGQKYLTAVVDHDSGRLVWMAPGRDKATVYRFFDDLGAERAARLELASADGAAWIEGPVVERAPQAVRCLDPFHIVQWATDVLDEVRRSVWNELRRGGGDPGLAAPLKGARWALWKNPEDLTSTQEATLSWVQHVNKPLYRAYMLKETLRTVFHEPTTAGAHRRLEKWLAWGPAAAGSRRS